MHASTGFVPNELQPELENRLVVDPTLIPEYTQELSIHRKIRLAGRKLAEMTVNRKKQADKKQQATIYNPGDLVWTKLHRRSNAAQGIAKKMHLLYEGPYRVNAEIRPNAYLIEDDEGNILGAYNSRQLRPHREAKMYVQSEEETPEEFAEIHILKIGDNEDKDTMDCDEDTSGSNRKVNSEQLEKNRLGHRTGRYC